jgi:hypothetical protein
MPLDARGRRQLTDSQWNGRYKERQPRYCLLSLEEFREQTEAYPPVPNLNDKSLARFMVGSMLTMVLPSLAMVWLIFALILPLVSLPASQLYNLSSVQFVPPSNYSYNVTSATGSFSMFSYHESVELSNVSANDGSVSPASYAYDSGYKAACSFSVLTNVTSIYVYPSTSRSDNIPSGDKGLQLSVPGCGGLWLVRLSALLLAVLIMPLMVCLVLVGFGLLQLAAGREVYEQDMQSGPDAAPELVAASYSAPSSSSSSSLTTALLSSFVQRTNTAAVGEPAAVERPAFAIAPMPSQREMTDWQVQQSQRRFLSYRKAAIAAQVVSASFLVLALVGLIAAPVWASGLGYSEVQWSATLYLHIAGQAVTVLLMPIVLLLIIRTGREEERQLMALTAMSGFS